MLAAERTTHATPAVLWTKVSDLENWAAMLPTIDEITALEPAAPVAVGSRFRVKQPGLPAAEYVVTDWRAGSGFTWQAKASGVTTTATHEIGRRGDRTHLEVGIAWSGPLGWLVPLLAGRKTRSYLAQEADTFVRLAEAEDAPGAAGS